MVIKQLPCEIKQKTVSSGLPTFQGTGHIEIWIYRVSMKYFPHYNHLLQKITWNKDIFCKEVFTHIRTLQNVHLLLYGESLIDNQFLSTYSPICLQLL